MWSMRSSATEGFTLSEMLLALGTAMLCSVLLTWMVRFFVIGIHTQQQLVQDQIAVLQLRLLCAEAQEVKVEADALQLRRFGKSFGWTIIRAAWSDAPGMSSICRRSTMPSLNIAANGS